MTALRSLLDPTARTALAELARQERIRPRTYHGDGVPPAPVVAAAPVVAGAPVKRREKTAADILVELRARDRATPILRAAVTEADPIPPMVFLEAHYVDGLPYRDSNYPWRPWMDRVDDDDDEDDEEDVPADQ